MRFQEAKSRNTGKGVRIAALPRPSRHLQSGPGLQRVLDFVDRGGLVVALLRRQHAPVGQQRLGLLAKGLNQRGQPLDPLPRPSCGHGVSRVAGTARVYLRTGKRVGR